MKREIIQTDRAPKAIGTYSQAVRVGDTVYISGQIPIDPVTNQTIAFVLAFPQRMTDWEIGFAQSIMRQRYPLTIKQLTILERLTVKARAEAGRQQQRSGDGPEAA